MMTVSVAIAVRDAVTREGVSHLLSTSPNVTVLSQGSSAAEALGRAAPNVPDALFVSTADAHELAGSLSPSTEVVFLQDVDSMSTLLTLHEGAATRHTLPRGIADLLRRLADPSERDLPDAAWGTTCSSTLVTMPGSPPLTAREGDVFALLSLGIRNRDIAKRLEVSEHTVKSHVKAILLKSGATTCKRLLASLAGGKP